MINRRQFITNTAAAGAAMLTRIPNARAATYDLLIKGGRVIDPSIGLDGIRDVAIAGGRIAAVASNITGDAADTIDAIDKIAVVARGAPQIGRALVNIARTGVVSPGGELHDINQANVALAQGAIARNRDIVIGVKARLSANVAGANDLEALRRAQEAAAPFNLPVMIHVGQNYSPMRAILPLLKRGDIVTHLYAPGMNGILDDKGILIPDVMAARRRGIIFDFGNGTADHFDWDTVEKATRQGFWPDTLSTDWNVMSRTTGVVDLPNVMSKLMMLGMPLSQLIATVTVNAARVFPA